MHPTTTISTLFGALVAAAVLVASPAALAGPVGASDTTVLIDQNLALAGGVTANDGPGFPITISQPGAYKLTGNLVAPAGINAIVVAAHDVSIDLNGFRIEGPGVCSGLPPTIVCSGSGKGISHGTVPDGNNAKRTEVRGGTISGFLAGVWVHAGSLVSDLRISETKYAVIALDGSRVSGITAHRVGHGVQVESGMVDRSVVNFANLAFSLNNSLGIGLHGSQLGIGANAASSAPGGVRESSFKANGPITGYALSLGNNLCNGVAC